MRGWKRNDLGVFITKIPERVKPVILVRQDNCDYVIGQVRGDAEEEILFNLLSYIIDGDERYGEKVRDKISDWGLNIKGDS